MTATREIDLRSDTVTMPTPAMREAMYRAQLGDDVYGEDPTVNHLERIAAQIMGKEAALFVPSGTMANLVCLLSHCRRGDEAIMGNLAHTFLFEAGGSSAVGGIHPHTVANQFDGTLHLDDVEAAIRDSRNVHYPRTRLICLENTHNRCGGAVLTPRYMSQVRSLADQYSLAVHLDGARIFNAAVALGLEAARLTCETDSVSFCLSKGLCAPAGSLVCGTAEFIQEARRQRKMLGGGMRQAGVLAAAGIVGIEQMVTRLAEDHTNARLLAEGLAELPLVKIEPERVMTNIVIFDLAPGSLAPEELTEDLMGRGVRIGFIGRHRFRAVTHYGIEAEDIEYTLRMLHEILAGRS